MVQDEDKLFTGLAAWHLKLAGPAAVHVNARTSRATRDFHIVLEGEEDARHLIDPAAECCGCAACISLPLAACERPFRPGELIVARYFDQRDRATLGEFEMEIRSMPRRSWTGSTARPAN